MTMNHVACELTGQADLARQPCNGSPLLANERDNGTIRPVAVARDVLHRCGSYAALTHVSSSIRTMSTENFSVWLKGQLRRREMTGSDLARKIDRPPSMVNRWTAGDRMPSPASCDLIADALAIDLDLVLFHAGHRPNIDVIDPDDPATTIISLAKRVDWSKDKRFEWVEGFMRQWINVDYGERKSKRGD